MHYIWENLWFLTLGWTVLLSLSTKCLVSMVWVKWTMSRHGLTSIMDIKSTDFIPLKSNVLLSIACVGAGRIIKSPIGCSLKKNLLSANEIDTSPVQGHCSWFAPAWKLAPRYFMGQCPAHNIAWKASRCHCIWIRFPFIVSLNGPLYCAVTVYRKIGIWKKIYNKCWFKFVIQNIELLIDWLQNRIGCLSPHLLQFFLCTRPVTNCCPIVWHASTATYQ